VIGRVVSKEAIYDDGMTPRLLLGADESFDPSAEIGCS
jgi:hypothetical protein